MLGVHVERASASACTTVRHGDTWLLQSRCVSGFALPDATHGCDDSAAPSNAAVDGSMLTDGAGHQLNATLAQQRFNALRRELDYDGDGWCNRFGDSPGRVVEDVRVCVGSDNCNFVPNPDQRDSDGDAHGDACDTGASLVTVLC